jgi:hypothetical protein
VIFLEAVYKYRIEQEGAEAQRRREEGWSDSTDERDFFRTADLEPESLLAVTLIVVCESPQHRRDGHAMNERYLRPPRWARWG